MSELMYQLLRRRGIASAQEAERFLHPDAASLHDPFLLSDMDQATACLERARAQGDPVWVYGDYDVDGVSACALLLQSLVVYGLKVYSYIPSRHKEGYGLNAAAVREIAEAAGCPEKTAVLLTVDCGISCASEVALAQELGLQVIVTDHHQPGENLPNCPTVNPLLRNYPFGYLCGTGVAFKLTCALLGWEQARQFIDLAALATVADIVPLIDENRVLVSLGLKEINQHPRPGIRALIQSAGLKDRAITAGHIGFQLAPRLNASGRLGDAGRAMRLLCGQDVRQLNAIVQELEQENTARKQVESEILDQAHELMKRYDLLRHKIIVLCGQDWNSGVIGLAAGRLAEEYHYPTILLSAKDGVCTGSCRSIPAVNIYKALCSCADLLTRFGGHHQAAGLTMDERHVDELLMRLDAHLREVTVPEDYIPEATYDMVLPLSLLSAEEQAAAGINGIAALDSELRADMQRSALLALDHAVAGERFSSFLGESVSGGEYVTRLVQELTQKAERLLARQNLDRARRKAIEQAEREAVESLELLQPTGYANVSPAFLSRVRFDSAQAVKNDTLKAVLSQDGATRQAIGFRMGALAGELAASEREIICCPQINRWNEYVSLQYELKEILPEDFDGAIARFEHKYQLVFNAYLRDLLYNNTLIGEMVSSASFEPLCEQQLEKWLREDVQGTVIAAVTREGAQSLEGWLRERELTNRLDVLIGRWPRDPACFNSLCLCPSGEAPVGCRQLVLWDAPAFAYAVRPQAQQTYECPARGCLWAREVPDVDQLRGMYVALRRLCANRPCGGPEAIRRLAQDTRTSEMAAACGTAILCRLELIAWTHTGSALQLLPGKKCDPVQDALYQLLHRLKNHPAVPGTDC